MDQYEKSFAYMPLMHSEQMDDQDLSVSLYSQLQKAHPDTQTNTLKFAKDHRDIVKRFGRFPHRNTVLGRTSTDEEVEFLKQPNSSF